MSDKEKLEQMHTDLEHALDMCRKHNKTYLRLIQVSLNDVIGELEDAVAWIEEEMECRKY